LLMPGSNRDPSLGLGQHQPQPTREGWSLDFKFTLNKLERFRQAFLMPLNTISMGQTTIKNQPGLVKTGLAVLGGGRSSGCGHRRLCSQGSRQSNWFRLVQPGGARILPVVGAFGSRWVPSRVSSAPGVSSRRGGPPRKRYAGIMCRRGWLLRWSTKTPHRASRAKAGRQRLGRLRRTGGGGGSQGLSFFPLRRGRSKTKQIGTAGVVHTSLLGVKSYD